MNKIFINPDYCKGCLICVECCPKQVLQASSRLNAKGYALPEAVKAENCTECAMCEIVCPDFAVAVQKSKEDKVILEE